MDGSNPRPREHRPLNLTNLGISLRVLFSCYLIVVSLGLLMAGAQIMMTHGMADGEIGLSVDDVVYSYYGNRGNSRLEAKLNGTMKDKADSHDRATIIQWVRNGSPQPEYEAKIAEVFAKNCLKCHAGIPGLADFSSYDKIQPYAQIDQGASVHSLTRFSHIHLFGIAFIFFFVCIIFSLAIRIPPLLKAAAIASPFLFLAVDVFAWWMTKWYPGFAYLTIFSGLIYNAASAFMILCSLYQMWLLPKKTGAVDIDAWVEA